MDIDSLTAHDMRFNPPTFSAEDVAGEIGSAYGLDGEWSPLPGERDQNFRLRTGDAQSYVVKIAGRDEDPAVTDFQVQALLHLEENSPQIPLPRIVRTRSGDCLGEIVDASGVSHRVRVVTYIEGIPYGEGEFPDAEHLKKIGSFMGGMVNALQGFEHEAARHFMPWNLSNGVAVSRDIWAAAAPDITAIAAPLLDRLRNEALPSLNACPSQVIHNDGHPYNLLRADAVSQDVVGLIDFGDMVHAPIINELAVTAATFQRNYPGELDAIENLLVGFHAAHPLSDGEVTMLWDAIILRLLITILLSDMKVELAEDEGVEAFNDRVEAIDMLVKAIELDHTATVNRFRAICGYA
jgi:Ser/Thr protein kinase RdoA (MazF antagonist)